MEDNKEFAEYGSRDLILMCRSSYEIEQMREYVSKHPNQDITANGFFYTLSADCLRYIEALKKAGIHANNIEKITELIKDVPFDFLEKVCNSERERVKAEQNKKFYYIIGNYINYPIGICTNEGLSGVNEEEPLAKFFEITKDMFDAFEESHGNLDRNFDWNENSLTYEEIVSLANKVI